MGGGVPRTILQSHDNTVPANTATLNRIEACMRFEGELHYTKVDSICGKLIHLVPMNDTCTEAQLDWASLKISNFALNVLIQDDKDKARNLITSTTDVGVYGSLRGHLFENLAHECIMLGG